MFRVLGFRVLTGSSGPSRKRVVSFPALIPMGLGFGVDGVGLSPIIIPYVAIAEGGSDPKTLNPKP